MPDTKSVLVLALLAIGPILLVTLTSFVKLSVVLALVRNGLGTQDVPSGMVVTSMALVLTLFIMAPTIQQVIDAAAPGDTMATRQWPSDEQGWLAAADRAEPAVKAFLARHVHAHDRASFVELASKLRGAPVADDDLAVLAPAFVTSELAEAFAIGFLLLLPFLVIDLVVGVSLQSLGLAQTSPQAVALPLKLLLFVAIDGWRLLAEGLLRGYA